MTLRFLGLTITIATSHASQPDSVSVHPAGSETPLELERRVETGNSSGLVGVGGVLDYDELIPPANPKFPWVAEDWQLLCYYCNQPIYEMKAVAGYRQRTVYMRGRWRHVDGDEWGCDKKLIRPQPEIDLPRCHVCGTQTRLHGGYCSVGGLPRFHATPMSQKEDEVTKAKSRSRTESPSGGGGSELVAKTVCDSPKSQNEKLCRGEGYA